MLMRTQQWPKEEIFLVHIWGGISFSLCENFSGLVTGNLWPSTVIRWRKSLNQPRIWNSQHSLWFKAKPKREKVPKCLILWITPLYCWGHGEHFTPSDEFYTVTDPSRIFYDSTPKKRKKKKNIVNRRVSQGDYQTHLIYSLSNKSMCFS